MVRINLEERLLAREAVMNPVGKATPRGAGGGGVISVVWALVPLLSIGLLTPFVFIYAAARLRERRMWLATGAYALACTLWLACASMPEQSVGPTVAGFLMLGLMTVGTTHAFLVRRRVFAPAAPQPAVRTALEARQKRQEARTLASHDAALAMELCIGRPDLPHEFDDGGLIDINHVPPSVLVDKLGLSPDQSTSVVDARDRLGGFSSADELVVYTELTPPTIDRIQDRIVFLA
jgi:hypothetical protein